MARCVVLLENTLDDQTVIDALAAMCAEGLTLHLAVPMRPLSRDDKEFVYVEADDTSEDENPVTTLAHWRLRKAVLALQDAGADEVVGQVVEAGTLREAQELLVGDGYDELVIVTDGTGVTRRLKPDPVGRIHRTIDIPVVHLQQHAG